ncbi:hypothetical protein Tco_0635265 [Tanacetum coccineum]
MGITAKRYNGVLNIEKLLLPTIDTGNDFRKQMRNVFLRPLGEEEEPAKKPKRAKKHEPAKQAETAKKIALAKKSSTMKKDGVVIKDTPGVSVSKKKAQAKVDRGKGMDLLSDVALLKVAQLKKVLKKSKQETHMLHVSGSSDGVGSQPKVSNELKEKTTGTNKGTGTIPGVPDVPKAQFESKNKSWGNSRDDDSNDDDSNDNVGDDEDLLEKEEAQDDEYVHTPEDYVHTEDKTNDESKEFDEEEYEEIYGDVNISLKDAEPTDKEKGNVEMTNTETGPILSSSISSDYAAKYLNFDNIPPVDIKVVSMLDINVQHEVPHTSPLLTIPVSVIPEHIVVNKPEIVTTALSTTISSLLISNLENDVKELKIIDHSAALLSTIKSEVPNAVKEYLGTSLDDALYKVLKKHDADIIKEPSVLAKILNRLRQ